VEGTVTERTRFFVRVEMSHEEADRVLDFRAQLERQAEVDSQLDSQLDSQQSKKLKSHLFRVDLHANTVTHDRMVRLSPNASSVRHVGPKGGHFLHSREDEQRASGVSL